MKKKFQIIISNRGHWMATRSQEKKNFKKNLHQHQMVTPQSRRRQQRQQQQYQNNYWPPSTFDNGGDNVE